MYTNRNVPEQASGPVININLSGNARLNWAHGDQASSSQRDVGPGPLNQQPFWKSMIFWTAVGALAATSGAIAVFL